MRVSGVIGVEISTVITIILFAKRLLAKGLISARSIPCFPGHGTRTARHGASGILNGPYIRYSPLPPPLTKKQGPQTERLFIIKSVGLVKHA